MTCNKFCAPWYFNISTWFWVQNMFDQVWPPKPYIWRVFLHQDLIWRKRTRMAFSTHKQKFRQALLNRFNVVYKLTCSCGASYIGQTQFNKSYRRASNVTKLCSMQTLASQPRSPGWLSQPWGHWQWQQLATAADSWIFVDSRTQTGAECKHPVDASMHF